MKSLSYLAHTCQAAPGVLGHLLVFCFRGFVSCWWESTFWLARCAVEELGDAVGTVRGEAVCDFSRDEFW